MAVQLQGGGGRGRGGRRKATTMVDINMTPFIDVMLVLLIVFMVAAPLMSVGVPVDLPQTVANPIQNPDEPLVITVNKEGRLYIGENELPEADLAPRLKAMLARRKDQTIFIRGDKGIVYGRVMEVMGRIAEAGFSKVSLIAELRSGASAPGDAAPAPTPAPARP